MHRFRGGLVFKAHRRLYHSTLGSRVIKKKKKTSAGRAPSPERLVNYCRTTSASTAPCTSRRICCLKHCDSHSAPCQPLLNFFSRMDSISTSHNPPSAHPTRWSWRVSFVRTFERYVTKCAPYKALKLIARGKLTFDERVVLHRVARGGGVPNLVSEGT